MNENYNAGRLRVGHNCGIYLKASFILYDFARWHRVVRFYIFQLLIYILLFNHVCKVTSKELANICTIVERVNESSLNLKTTNALLTHFNLRGEESNENKMVFCASSSGNTHDADPRGVSSGLGGGRAVITPRQQRENMG